MQGTLAQFEIDSTVAICCIVALHVTTIVSLLIATARGKVIKTLQKLLSMAGPEDLPDCFARLSKSGGLKEFSAEKLGQVVRAAWVVWARRQPGAKESWLIPWTDLPDEAKQADREIGFAVAEFILGLILKTTKIMRDYTVQERDRDQQGSVPVGFDARTWRRGEMASWDTTRALLAYVAIKINRESRKNKKAGNTDATTSKP